MFCAYSFHGNSMNNLLSYCGIVDARISASEKDLPVFVSISDQCRDYVRGGLRGLSEFGGSEKRTETDNLLIIPPRNQDPNVVPAYSKLSIIRTGRSRLLEFERR